MAKRHAIRELMQEAAEIWNGFPEPISPFLAAAEFGGELARRRLRYDTYIQTVITGGGHVHDPELTNDAAVQRNIDNALKVADVLHDEGIIDLGSCAEAAAMPHINGWTAEDWMTFWPLIISKPVLHQDMGPGLARVLHDKALYLEKEFEYSKQERRGFLDMTKHNDRSITKSERLEHYDWHVNALHQTISGNNVNKEPVWRIIGLLGIEESVGSLTERRYAKNAGIRTFRAVLANIQPLAPEQLDDQRLARDITRLRKLGVQALAGAPSQRFMLVEDHEPWEREVVEYS